MTSGNLRMLNLTCLSAGLHWITALLNHCKSLLLSKETGLACQFLLYRLYYLPRITARKDSRGINSRRKAEQVAVDLADMKEVIIKPKDINISQSWDVWASFTKREMPNLWPRPLHSQLAKSNIDVLMLLQRKLLTLFYIKGRVLVTLAQFMMKALLQKASVNASDFINCCSLQAIKLLIFSPKRSSISYLFNY